MQKAHSEIASEFAPRSRPGFASQPPANTKPTPVKNMPKVVALLVVLSLPSAIFCIIAGIMDVVHARTEKSVEQSVADQ